MGHRPRLDRGWRRGNAASDVTRAAARALRERVDQARRGAHRVQQVSAGAARLLAIDHVVSSYPDELGPPDTEVIEERSSYEPLVTLSYAAEDPWIVVLISASLRFRYIIVVMPDGAIADARRARIGKLERLRG
jgi:hypothetical protein